MYLRSRLRASRIRIEERNCINSVTAFRNLADRLAPAGDLICEVPNSPCKGARRAGIAWGHLDIPRQANVFTLKSLTRLVEPAGLHVAEVRWAQYCRQFHLATIEDERRKFDFFTARGSDRTSLPQRPTLRSRSSLLAATLFASPRLKYDALRLLARRPEGSTPADRDP